MYDLMLTQLQKIINLLSIVTSLKSKFFFIQKIV